MTRPAPPKGSSGVSGNSWIKVSVSETCRCGWSTTVTGMSEKDTLYTIRSLRAEHPCAAADDWTTERTRQ